ncbi:MAG: SIMPL domain-containing protein [Ilumatobacteraceae bacterium]|nr:SIMPL domain-containing protein [Ilumatobacteraceae bacterium]
MRKINAAIVFAVSALVLVGCGDTVNVGDNGVSQGITVQATGVADVVPDAVQVSLSVSVVAEANDVALSQVAATAEVVRATLEQLGIDAADIATQSVSVNPEYSYTEAEGQKIVGYRASQTFDVLVRDASAAGAVVDSLVAAGGANLSINATYPVVNDSTAAAQAARDDAVAKARAKAEEYAELLEVELGDLVFLTEISAPTNITIGAKADVMAESALTVIDLGTQEVTVTVEVRWQID